MLLKRLQVERWALVLGTLLLAFGLVACDGDDGQDGLDGQDGRDATVSSTAVSSDEMEASITNVSIASPPVVDFVVKTKADASVRDTGVAGLVEDNFRFYMARLENGAAAGDSTRWISYYGPPADTSGFASDTGGTFVDNGDGTYRYTFGRDITQVAGYRANATHRLVIEVSDVMAADGEARIFNPHLDFRPDGQALTLTRDIADMQANCNGCHGVLAFHGGGTRMDTVESCTVCHGAGPTSQDTSDFKRMIHKTHRNVNVDRPLPTDPLRGDEVIHPQDTRNCSTCHNEDNPDTADAQNWFTVPTQESCSACHDGAHCSGDTPTDQQPGDSLFCAAPVDAHMGNLANSQCSTCHTPQSASPGATPGGIPESHIITNQVLASQYQYNIIGIDDGAGNAQVAPGSAPSVTFTITDPTNLGGANDPDGLGERYDLSGDPIDDPALAGANTRMTVAFVTTEYTNEGNGQTEAQPQRTNVISGGALVAGAVDNGDRSYTLALTAIPAGTGGSDEVSGAVTMEGHPNPGTGNLAVRSEVAFFPITDSSAQPRRTVVRIGENCNDCHQQLALHGANRVDNEQDCVTCHNPNATDLNRRPAAGAGSCDPAAGSNVGEDGKCEQAIDFKYMVHAIHAKNTGVYGFSRELDDFAEVAFPEAQLSNCLACHAEDAYYPDEDGPVLGTTIQSVANYATLSDRATGDDNIRISPWASVCSGCHVPDVPVGWPEDPDVNRDDPTERDDPNSTNQAKLHMEQNGADFRLEPGDPNQETCSLCHGQGRSVDIGVVHGLK